MRPQIKSFGMATMHAATCLLFHQQVLNEIRETTPEVLHIEAMVPTYEAASKTLASVLNRQRGFVATHRMQRWDQMRSRAYGTIKMVINSYKSSVVPENHKAAQHLILKLSPFKGLHRHKYKKRSAGMGNMLVLLTQPENAEAIARLGLSDEVEAMRQAHTAYLAALDEKISEMAQMMEKREIDTGNAMRQLNALYADIVQVANAHAIVTPTPAILDFVKNVNGLVGMYSGK